MLSSLQTQLQVAASAETTSKSIEQVRYPVINDCVKDISVIVRLYCH